MLFFLKKNQKTFSVLSIWDTNEKWWVKVAVLWSVAGNGPFPGIIDLYGTGGGLPEYRACLLANYGFAVLALAFYGYEDLPKEMKEFHLEYFEEAINYMLKHTQVGFFIDSFSLLVIIIS